MDAQEAFYRASGYVALKSPELDLADLSFFYGHSKQAVEGPCREPMPTMFSFQKQSKWESWHSLGEMSREEAMEQYVDRLNTISPDWDAKDSDLEDESKTPFDWVKEENVGQLQQSLDANKSIISCQDEQGFPVTPGTAGQPGLIGLPEPKGLKGDGGFSIPGPNGPRGEPGIEEESGIFGEKGGKGEPGEKVDKGIAGFPGSNGGLGLDGLPGIDQLPGTPAPKGETALPGFPGLKGLPGEKGEPGLPGLVGLQGPPGPPAFDELPGYKGEPSLPGRGLPGAAGLPGECGPEGQPGLPGFPETKGSQGLPGFSASKEDIAHYIEEKQDTEVNLENPELPPDFPETSTTPELSGGIKTNESYVPNHPGLILDDDDDCIFMKQVQFIDLE